MLLLGLSACGSDDPIVDQASGSIDKSPASWSEPGASADPPVVRDAGPGDAALDAASASCQTVALTAADDACRFTISAADAARELEILLDGLTLRDSASDGYQLDDTALTIVGPSCQKLRGVAPADAGSDAGTDAGTDAGSDAGQHVLEARSGACRDAG